MSKQQVAFFSCHITDTINPVSGLVNRDNQLHSVSKWDSKKCGKCTKPLQIFKTRTNIINTQMIQIMQTATYTHKGSKVQMLHSYV